MTTRPATNPHAGTLILVLLSVIVMAPLLAAGLLEKKEISYEGSSATSPWNMDWVNDPIWYDGKAEYAVYESTRTIYGKSRTYETVIITNKQYMDPKTTTKAADWQAPGMIEVFKHNVREVIPTENYDYKYLTTSFTRTADLRPFKLTMSSQEDCGATFKQFVIDGSRLRADQFVYFPDDGHLEDTARVGESFHFFDELSLVLRGYPWSRANAGDEIPLQILPEQTDTHQTAMQPVAATARFKGVETLDLPVGSVEAFRVEVRSPGENEPLLGTFWFATDGGGPRVRLMVQFEGPGGLTHRLKSVKRWAYWER